MISASLSQPQIFSRNRSVGITWCGLAISSSHIWNSLFASRKLPDGEDSVKVERSSVTLPNVSLESPDVRLRVIARSVASSSLVSKGLVK